MTTPNRKPARKPAPRPKPRAGVPDELTDSARGRRLQKVLAEAGVAARRQCEAMIRAGRVRVNGDLVTALPAWVDPQRDRIEVDGEPVRRPRRSAKSPARSSARSPARRAPAAGRAEPATGDPGQPTDRLVYVMLNKPRHVISTTRDPQGRPKVTDLVDVPPPHPDAPPPRLFPVGRLDADSTGLILLTNDGELANRLTHPRYGVPRQYIVSVRGALSEEDVQRLQDGLYLAHRSKAGLHVKRAAMTRARLMGTDRDRTRGDRTNLMVTLHEGQNREIRRLLARLGFKVRRLERVAIGPLRLKGLARGQWRLLTAAEVGRLRRAAKGE